MPKRANSRPAVVPIRFGWNDPVQPVAGCGLNRDVPGMASVEPGDSGAASPSIGIANLEDLAAVQATERVLRKMVAGIGRRQSREETIAPLAVAKGAGSPAWRGCTTSAGRYCLRT